MTIWGNHSATQYPDLYHAEVGGKIAAEQVDDALAARRVHPDRRQARRRDHRGARRVVGGVGGQRGHRPRLRLGQRHGRRRLDLGRDRRRTAPTASPRASSPASPSPRERRAGRSCRAWRSTSSPAPASTPPSPSSRRSATRCKALGSSRASSSASTIAKDSGGSFSLAAGALDRLRRQQDAHDRADRDRGGRRRARLHASRRRPRCSTIVRASSSTSTSTSSSHGSDSSGRALRSAISSR